MEYESNGLRRTIAGIVRMTGAIAFGAWENKYKQPKFIENSAQDSLYQKIIKMIDKGEINEAENILLSRIDIGRKEYLELALLSYSYMNDKTDDFLEKHDFTREEIEMGLHRVVNQFGLQMNL